jgi:hypothetical protein
MKSNAFLPVSPANLTMKLPQLICPGPKLMVFLLACACCCDSARADAIQLALDGQWRFALDRGDAGISQRWFTRTLDGQVRLPGALPAQGIGDDVSLDTKWTGGIRDPQWHKKPLYAPYTSPENFKFPFWLQPDKYYAGAAWYQRDLEIPVEWAGKRVELFLERPHWETRVWLNEKFIGSNLSLSTPHDYCLGVVEPGKHTLTIRVDNRMVIDIGHDSHSVSDHTQGNWNGIVGKLELRAMPPVWIDDLQIYPRVAERAIAVRGRLGNATGKAGRGRIELRAERPGSAGGLPVAQRVLNVTWESGGGVFESELALGQDALLWDEFNPALYRLAATLDGSFTKTAAFGLVEFRADGTQFAVNGRKTYIRGTLECAIFPKTGHPPTDVESWRRIIGIAKDHGLNNIRFHSWCPPQAAFIAADELGFYLHPEASSWANSSTTLGDGKPVDAWVYEETDRILRHYGNHPSFVLMAYGNEPGGPRHREYLAEWVNTYKAKDPRRLYTSGAGWPEIPENEWHCLPDPRVQAWGAGLMSRINSRPPETRSDYRSFIQARKVPVVSHEIGQWCVYPNFDEIPKYTGYLKAKNFEIFRDTLDARHMGSLARKFLHASGKLQTLCYKEDIESALRTPGMGGFQLLDLRDFPGQGTALVGVLDPFWDSKGYVTAAEFSRFCNSTVPLARLEKRVFTQDETLSFSVEAAHFGPAPLTNIWPVFRLLDDDGRVYWRGHSVQQDLPIGNGNELAKFELSLSGIPAPARYRLVVRLAHDKDANQTLFENDWDIWLYPPKINTDPPQGILVVEELNDRAIQTLAAGGKVLFLLPPNRVQPDPQLGKVALGFSSIFWNTAWTDRQPPHTLGILCDPTNPLFAAFPTDAHTNWQWWYLISRAGAMILDGFPPAFRPTVQVIDDWFTNRRLGLVFEAAVENGKLLVCSIDLQTDLDADPVRRQFRHSLLLYMASGRFQPNIKISAAQVRGLMTAPSAMEKLGAKVHSASSEQPGFEAANVLDGNPRSMWHTAWEGGAREFPHELTIELQTAATLRGLTVLPRQDGNRNGWIKDYSIHLSLDGRNWDQPVAQGTFSPSGELKAVLFERPAMARFVRLTALSGHAKGPWASLAELELLD